MEHLDSIPFYPNDSADVKPRGTIVRRLDNTAPEDPYFKASSFSKVVEDGSLEPDRKSICGAFVYENTITYFFSRTNYGKSIFAFQVAYAAATGTGIDPCLALRNDCEPMKVLLFDLENDKKTISERHGRAVEVTKPELLENLVYMYENNGRMMALGFDLLDKIERCAVDHGAKLIIIDNISRLLPDSLKPDIVTRIIARLQQIREKTGAALLVIGHTTKGDPRTAVSSVSYYGSAMLQNFFTEMFYLDTTKDGRFFLSMPKPRKMRGISIWCRSLQGAIILLSAWDLLSSGFEPCRYPAAVCITT